MKSVRPRARTDRLVTREVGDELLVYDLERHKAYCLNRVAMQVFRHCDGDTTISEMTRRIGKVFGQPVEEQAIRLGLVRLEKAHLLDIPVGRLDSSRRHMLRTLGRAAVVGLPLVSALTVPTSTQAASCACGMVFSGQLCGGCMGTCGRRCTKTCVPGGRC